MTRVTTVVVIVLALVTLEVVSWALAFLLARFGRPIPNRKKFLMEQSVLLERLASNQSARARIHPVLGWEYGTDVATETDHLNARGLRATREYDVQRLPGVTRVAAFGDSYTYCNEVVDSESWPSQIEVGWNAEVLNYGTGGYGVDQAFLRFSDEGASLHPQIVIICLTTMMAPRVVSRYRRFQDPRDGPWFKPRFVLAGDALRFIPAPVSSREDANRLLADPASVAQFGQTDFWYDPVVFEHWLYPRSATYRLLAFTSSAISRRYFHANRIFRGRLLNSQSEAFALLVSIVREFGNGIREIGAQPLVLMLPARGDVESYARSGVASYDPLRARIEQMGMAVLDAAPALIASQSSLDELFASGGHYSVAGNAVVARALATALHLAPRGSNPGDLPVHSDPLTNAFGSEQ